MSRSSRDHLVSHLLSTCGSKDRQGAWLADRDDPEPTNADVVVVWAGDELLRDRAARSNARVAFYALMADEIGSAQPVWMGAPIASVGGAQPFELFVGGSASRVVMSPVLGQEAVRDAVGAIAFAAECAEASLPDLFAALARFEGAPRHQELIGVAHGIRVYEDEMGDPSGALAAAFPAGRVFEVRSENELAATLVIAEAGDTVVTVSGGYELAERLLAALTTRGR